MKQEITNDFMVSIGYKQTKDDGTYSTYENVHPTKSTFYGIMGNGKRIIHFNNNWHKDYTFCLIEEDAGTRKVFHGGIKTEQDLIKVLELVY